MPSQQEHRILVVEDDPRYRSSVETLLRHAPGFFVARAVGTAQEATSWAEELARTAQPCAWDVALVDLQLPDQHGTQATAALKRAFPDVPVVILTVFEEPATILQAICAGADGYLLKKASAKEFLESLRSIASGGAPLTPGVARAVVDLLRKWAPAPAGAPAAPSLDLTAREQDVLRCLVQGLSYKQVADALDVSVDTVRSHIRQLYKKLQVHSVSAAVSRAVREGLV